MVQTSRCGNHGSTYGNEWGINLYLNGILQADGTTILPAGGSLGANTPLAEQQRLLALRAANGNMEVQNQGYSALNRTAAYVSTTGSNSNQGSPLGNLATIQAGVNAVVTGGTVYVANGNYNLGSSQLKIDHALSLIGASQGGVAIDGRAVSANGLGTISVLADNVSLSNFSLLGSQLSGGNYGIKVAPNPAGHVNTAGGTNERVSNFAISNVTVSGSRRAELDLNGVVGATITNFTANGQGTDGAGVQITDSSDVTLIGVHTLGNNWGGVALYQSNSNSGYNAQTTNINIDASQNVFEEANGLFTQRDSTTQSFGQLNLTGFNYAVRNIGSRPDASQFVWFQTSLANATGFSAALGAAGSSIEGYTGTAFSNNFTVVAGMTIGAALRDARAGANISVGAGTYAENVLINKSGVTLTSTDGRDATTVQGIAGVGALGAVTLASGANNLTLGTTGHGFTITGFDNGNAGIENAALYVQGNHNGVTIQGNRITANGDLGMVSEYSAAVSNFTIDGNIFDGKTFVGAAPATGDQFSVPNVSRQLVAMGGGNGGGNTSNIAFTNNQVIGDSGLNSAVTIDAQGATITGNSFGTTTGGFGTVLRARGTNTLVSGNDFDLTNVAQSAATLYLRDSIYGAGQPNFGVVVSQNDFNGFGGVWTDSGQAGFQTLFRSIQSGVAAASVGDTVHVLDGTYVLAGQLALTRSVNLVGQSQAGTIIDGRTVNNGGGLGTIMVAADNTSLSNFTLLGSTLSGGNYGIKVQPNPLGYTPTGGPDQRISNIAISNVTVRGSRRAELDINGAIGVTLNNFTADGQGTEGAGVQITDSANVTLTGVHTLNNNWGGVALYQTNRAGGYNGQTTNINIDASQNEFDEANGLFAQLESTSQGFGQLNLTGFGYAVRNTGSRADGSQFTYFRTDLTDATGWALGLGAANTSSIEGYTGSAFSNVFTVVNGLSIGAAARDVRTNGTINVGTGTYASGTMLTANGVSLLGQAGAKIDASHDGDNGITVNADGVTVSGFEIFGPADQSFVTYSWPTITRGVVVANGADNVTVSGNNIHDVRNGILIDGRNANTSLTGNTIDNTKSAISVQYTDGSNLNIAGNSEGAFGNEWGIITYLNGIWNGSTITASAGALGANTPLSEQARLLSLSAANNGMSVYNQGYSAANRTRAYVTTTGVGGAQGSERTLLNLQGGLNAVVAGGTVYIGGGTYNENVSLDALRVLNIAGPITVNSLSFGAGAAGTNIGTDVTATGALSFAVGPVLTGNTVLTGDTVSLGAITSAFALTLNGANGVSIGLADLSSLVANGSSILTAGVTTSGAQSYAGATTLNGNYVAGGDFTVNGATTLASDASVTISGGNATLGAVGGAGALSINAGTGNVSLGAVTGLASLSASGTSIATLGAATSGAQTYTGAATLSGTYTAGGAFTVNGATTLAGSTTVNTSPGNANIVLGTISGANALTLTANGGNVTIGAVSGLASLSAGGANIVTAGATTTGAQLYGGTLISLNGTYTAGGSLTFGGATQLTGNVVADGNGSDTGNSLGFGAIAGNGYNLIANAHGGQLRFGTVSNVGTLTGTGGTISTQGASTSGAQTYNGAGVFSGIYATNGGAFTVNGSATIAGTYTTNGGAFAINGTSMLGAATSVTTAGGNASFGNFASFGFSSPLTVNAGTGNVTLGTATGISVFNATGGTITTSGLTTTGAQTYTGAATFNGTYSAGGNFTVTGATTLTGNTSVTSSGNANFGTISGARSLSVNAASSVTLGAVSGLTSLSATGATIATAGASTSGAQSYTGATSLNGAYTTNGAAFTVNGVSSLTGTTSVATAGGNAIFGTVDATGTGSALSVNAGTGNVTLGAATGLGSLTATGATIATVGVTSSGVQSFTGATSLNGTYNAGGTFTVNGATTLAGDSSVATSGGNASFGTVAGGGNGLTVNAGSGGVVLDAASGLASLNATGATIVTKGVTTNGAQSYTGATTLNGAYATNGGSFAANGATTLAGTTNLATTGGNATFGTIAGGNRDLTINAGSGDVTLGAAAGLDELNVQGSTITTAGVSSSSDQVYTGTTRLSGLYRASDFDVFGSTTLIGSTTIRASDVWMRNVNGNYDLTIGSNFGSVTLGMLSGLTDVSVSAEEISVLGATTSGSQMFNAKTPGSIFDDVIGGATHPTPPHYGPVSLNGVYEARDFTAAGAITLGGDTHITAVNDASLLGPIDGAHALTVDAGRNVTLTDEGMTINGFRYPDSTISGIASLSVNGASIFAAGVTTSGAQSYTGATNFAGTYSAGGDFTVNGATTLRRDTNVTADNASVGTVSGRGTLTVDAAGDVTLGAVTGLTSLSVSGANIATNGATTNGAQSYTGATTLGGAYAASSLAVSGATALNGATSVTTSGNASFGTIAGNSGFTVNAGAGSVSLGAVTGVTNLAVTGASIASNGAATSGTQAYTGATSLNGAYAASGFTVTGATNLVGNTSVTTANGAIALGAVDAAVAGGQSLTLNAGTGSVALGTVGATRRLGATAVNGGSTVLNGATYAANSLSFTGGTGSTVRLTQGSTTFNTSLPGGGGGAIAIQPNLTGTVNAQQNVTFTAGNGLTLNSGDVAIGNAGSDAIRLGTMSVTAHNFSAATVKLASTFTSVLSGSQVFSANTLDTLGNVNARVAGNESGPIRAGGSVTIDAGGSGSGSIIAGGPVNAQYDSSVNRTITSQSNVTIESLGAIGGSVTATGAVDLQTTSGAITSAVNAGGPVSANSTSGNITAAITSSGPVEIQTTTGSVTSTVNTPGTASISSQTGAVNATVTGNGGVSVETNGTITGTYNSPTAIELTSSRPVDVQVNGAVVTVTAPSGNITGVFSEIHTNDQGTFLINEQPVVGSGTTDARQIIIDTFIIPTRGTVSANGEIQLPAGLALGLIAPAGNGQGGGGRPAVVVNNVQRLGELLREGYTAIIIQLDETNLDLEEEVAGQ